MADVTIGQLTANTPNKNSAVIPYSDGITTYRTAPSGIVAASPGCILRVTQKLLDTVVSVPFTSTSGSLVIPGLSASIVPMSLSNNILVDVSVVGGATNYVNLRLERSLGGSIFTGVGVGKPTGNRKAVTSATFSYESTTNVNTGAAFKYLDSPNTLSEVIYRVNLSSYHASGTFNLNSTASNGDAAYVGVAISTITLWEIAG